MVELCPSLKAHACIMSLPTRGLGSIVACSSTLCMFEAVCVEGGAFPGRVSSSGRGRGQGTAEGVRSSIIYMCRTDMRSVTDVYL